MRDIIRWVLHWFSSVPTADYVDYSSTAAIYSVNINYKTESVDINCEIESVDIETDLGG